MSTDIYQDRRTGKRVVLVGSAADKEDFVMVKGTDNIPYYASRSHLLPCDAAGTPDFKAEYIREEEPEEQIPQPTISVIETRLNVNTATAEEIAKRVPGVGYRIAKKIKDLQLAQPGEVFRTLEQLKASSNRVNWDEVFESNTLFVA
jgi:DNA uptake protein ComE-like DNA-binding protein